MSRLASAIRNTAQFLLSELTPPPPQLLALAATMRSDPAPDAPRIPNPFAPRRR